MNSSTLITKRLTIFCLVCSGGLGAALLASGDDAGSTPLTQSEIENFLLHAKIMMSESLPIGVTQSRKATLSNGTLTKEAHVQTIDFFKKKFKIANRTELNFRDSYKFNIAAYRIDKLLKQRMVPVSVERVVKGQPAAITWWVEDVTMMELERTRRGIQPPDSQNWERQMSRVQVFTELIANSDQNQSNLLITSDWKIWLIDFTRAFGRGRPLPTPICSKESSPHF